MAISGVQNRAINEALNAAKTCKLRAVECDRLGLGTLAREYEYFSRSLVENVERQKLALQEDGNDISKTVD